MNKRSNPQPVEIPEIMTANTYFWSPSGNASSRRRNEARRNGEVSDFLAAHADELRASGVEVDFSYSESCAHVYKRCAVTRDGKRSNITAVRKALGL